MKMFHFVYLTSRLGTNYYYIGVHSTDNMLDGYIGSGYHLRNAVNKYGYENFARCVIKYFDTHEEALKYENKILTEKVLNDRYCYNIQHGGKGSKEEHLMSTREKISEALRGRKLTEKQIEILRKSNTGRKKSLETKRKISETLKKKDMGQYNRGRVQSQGEKIKRSLSIKKSYSEGRIKRPDNRGNKNPMYNRHHTEETKKKLSETGKERFKNINEREKTSLRTSIGMRNSDKWNKYQEDIRNGIRSSSMKGKKNPNLGSSMKLAMHIRWHKNRGIFNKECEYCVSEQHK